MKQHSAWLSCFQIYLGGLDNFLQPGKSLQSQKNFTGCLENVWFDYMNIIRDARAGQARFASHGSVLYGACQVSICVGLLCRVSSVFWVII